MKNVVLRAMAVLVLLCTLAPSTFAASSISPASPHFTTSGATVDFGGDLVVKWREVGLGPNASVLYTVTSTGNAVYACVNPNTHHIGATDTFTGYETMDLTLIASGQGTITGSQLVNPEPAVDFTCQINEFRTLAAVSYTDVTIIDNTNNVTETLGGTYRRVFLPH